MQGLSNYCKLAIRGGLQNHHCRIILAVCGQWGKSAHRISQNLLYFVYILHAVLHGRSGCGFAASEILNFQTIKTLETWNSAIWNTNEIISSTFQMLVMVFFAFTIGIIYYQLNHDYPSGIQNRFDFMPAVKYESRNYSVNLCWCNSKSSNVVMLGLWYDRSIMRFIRSVLTTSYFLWHSDWLHNTSSAGSSTVPRFNCWVQHIWTCLTSCGC